MWRTFFRPRPAWVKPPFFFSARIARNLAFAPRFPIERKGEYCMAAKKTSSKKSSAGRKYSPEAGNKVERAMREKNSGTLKSGRSGKKVTSRKQAIAIGLSEARKEGAKVPNKKSAAKTSSSRGKKSSRT